MKKLFVLVAVLCVAAGCRDSGNPTDPSQVVIEFSTTDLVVGTGAEAVNGTQATIGNWELWLYDPSGPASKGVSIQNQSSLINGAPAGPIVLVVGGGRFIPGFEQGVRGMRVGGKRRIYMPPSMAYGSTGSGSIPPNASLVFEIELTALQ